MQAIATIVYILRTRRMQLHHAFLLIPKQIFDEAHFIPVWRTPWRRHRDMLPSRTDEADDLELTATRPLHVEETGRTRSRCGGKSAVADAPRLEFFCNLAPHAFSFFWPIEWTPAPLVSSESYIERLPPRHGKPQILLIICTELIWMKNIGSVRNRPPESSLAVGLSTMISTCIFSSCVTSLRTCLMQTIRADTYDGFATQAASAGADARLFA